MTPIWSVFTPEEIALPLSVGNKVLIISDNDTSHKQALKLYPGAMHMLPHNSVLGWKDSLSEFAILDHIIWHAPSPVMFAWQMIRLLRDRSRGSSAVQNDQESTRAWIR